MNCLLAKLYRLKVYVGFWPVEKAYNNAPSSVYDKYMLCALMRPAMFQVLLEYLMTDLTSTVRVKFVHVLL